MIGMFSAHHTSRMTGVTAMIVQNAAKAMARAWGTRPDRADSFCMAYLSFFMRTAVP